MPNLMPSEVKPAKMDKIASTNTDDIRSWFRHARGYLKYSNVSPDEERSVFWAAGFFEGPLSKWWHQRCTMTGDEVAGGLSSVTDLEQAVIENFVGRKPAEQARLNLDKARQTGRVLKYANYFREQLLELPHRHEEDNVHDFLSGLRPSVHREVALKDPRTLTEAIQAALRAEAAEQRVETETVRKSKFSGSQEKSRLNHIAATDTDEEVDSDEGFESADEEEHCYQMTTTDQKSTTGEQKCYYCGKKGHYKRECRKWLRDTKKPGRPGK